MLEYNTIIQGNVSPNLHSIYISYVCVEEETRSNVLYGGTLTHTYPHRHTNTYMTEKSNGIGIHVSSFIRNVKWVQGLKVS